MVNQILLGLVESVLGKSNPTARGNHAFHCAFCHHKNPKLEINLIPNKKKENLWHCWVCDKKGKTLFGLFKVLKVSANKRTQLNNLGFRPWEESRSLDLSIRRRLPISKPQNLKLRFHS